MEKTVQDVIDEKKKQSLKKEQKLPSEKNKR